MDAKKLKKTFCKLKRKNPEAIAASPIDDVIEIKREETWHRFKKEAAFSSSKSNNAGFLHKIAYVF